MAKYVYLVESMQYNFIDNVFATYDRYIYTSYKKAILDIDNIIEVNKGFDIEKGYGAIKTHDYESVDYKWYSSENFRNVRCRLYLRRIKMR